MVPKIVHYNVYYRENLRKKSIEEGGGEGSQTYLLKLDINLRKKLERICSLSRKLEKNFANVNRKDQEQEQVIIIKYESQHRGEAELHITF